MFNKSVRNVEFELTNRCNAGCPLCSRTGTNKGGLSDPVSNSGWKDVSKEVHHHVIDSLRKDHDIESIDYGGCYGDPLMHPKVLELLQYGEGIYQEVQTNASLQTDKFWQSVAKIDKLRMWFHLDGLEDTNHIYRRYTNWSKIERNAKTFLDAGGKGSWVFIVFRHNEHQVEEARELSKKWGFDEFIIKKTSRKFENGKHKTSKQVRTPHGIETITYEAPTNPEYQAESVQNSVVTEIPIDCYSEKRGTFYISCEDKIYPCCVLGKEGFKNNHIDRIPDKVFDYIDYDITINPDTNKFNNIVDKYNGKEDIYRLNWQERKFKHCIERCGRDVTCQKVHLPLNPDTGSKRFEGWEGPHNKRNIG